METSVSGNDICTIQQKRVDMELDRIERERMRDAKAGEKWFTVFAAALAAIALAALMIAIAYGDSQWRIVFGKIAVKGDVFEAAMLVFGGIVFYLAGSFRTIDGEHIGLLSFFKRPIKNLRPGLVFVPRWVCDMETYPQDWQSIQHPGDASIIHKGGGDVPEGKLPPLRVVSAKPDAEDGDPINKRVVSEIVAWLQVRVINPIVFKTTIGNMEEATKHIKNLLETHINVILAKYTPSEAFASQNEINEGLRIILREETKRWGVLIGRVEIKDNDLGKNIASAMQKPVTAHAEANAERIRKITVAEGTRKELTLEGMGRAAAIAEVIEQESKSLKEAMEAMGIENERAIELMIARLMRETYGNTEKVVVAGAEGGTADLIKSLTAAAHGALPLPKK